MTNGVRERARRALRTEIAEALSTLFAERGFDAVTVEDAAREVGISRATFFRYFGSKEDAVIATIENSTIDFSAVLKDLPGIEGDNAWRLLCRTFQHALAMIDDDSRVDHDRLRMIHTTPSLRSRLTERRYAQEDSLTAGLERRGVSQEIARPAVAAALAAVDLAWRRWARGEEQSLRDALEQVFAQLIAANAPISEQTTDIVTS